MTGKQKALLEMRVALENLRSAWIQCNEAFNSCFIDCNDYILGTRFTENEYPFHRSFDEMDVTEWIDGCLEKIEKDLSEDSSENMISFNVGDIVTATNSKGNLGMGKIETIMDFSPTNRYSDIEALVNILGDGKSWHKLSSLKHLDLREFAEELEK